MGVKRNVINLQLGTELEFEKLSFINMCSVNGNFNKMQPEGRKWIVTEEDTVETKCHHTGAILGGEFVSPIYKFESQEFLEDVSSITNILKEHRTKITNKTSNHFHFNANYFKNNLEWYNLIELWLAYEPIIYRFGYDDNLMGRSLAWDYARPLGVNREKYLDLLDRFRDNYILLEDADSVLRKSEFPMFKKEKGLSFAGVIYDGYTKKDIKRHIKFNPALASKARRYIIKPKKPTIEFRNCDMSLDPFVIEQRANMFGNMMRVVKEEKLDIAYLRYLNMHHYCQIKERSDFVKYKTLDLSKAFEFACMIYDNKKEDVSNFMKIYRKGE